MTGESEVHTATCETEMNAIYEKYQALTNNEEWEHWKLIKEKTLDCSCGKELICDDYLTNTCDCGRDYDYSGNNLSPREQWGSETGEHYMDIVREDF